MHSVMLNADISLHRSTISCTSFTQFPSSCPQHCCPTLVGASASSSSQGQGTFTRKEPFVSGTSWSSSSTSRAYGITPSSALRKGRQSYLTSSGCHINRADYTCYCWTLPFLCSVCSSSQYRTSIPSWPQTHPTRPQARLDLMNRVKTITPSRRRHCRISLTSGWARSSIESGIRHPRNQSSQHGGNSCHCLTRCRRS